MSSPIPFEVPEGRIEIGGDDDLAPGGPGLSRRDGVCPEGVPVSRVVCCHGQ